MCATESTTDLTYPPHIVLNGRKYVPVGTPTPHAPKREYKVGQRWLANDASAYTVSGPASNPGLHRDRDDRIMICTEEFMDSFLIKLVRNAPAVDLKVGMLIRGLRIGSEGSIVGVNPLRVAVLGHEDGIEMAMTDDAEVCWPWGMWQRVYPVV